MPIGKKIKWARESLKLTQPQLAEAVAVHPRTITSWENDKTHPLNRLPVLEQVLGISLSEDGTNSPASPDLHGLSDESLFAELDSVLRELRLRLASRTQDTQDVEAPTPIRPAAPLPHLDPDREGEKWAARRRPTRPTRPT